MDRRPGGLIEPTIKDTRWRKRIEVWQAAKENLGYWERLSSREMAIQIATIAKFAGFYSIWKTVFANEPEVIAAIEEVYPNTFIVFQDGQRKVREKGRI